MWKYMWTTRQEEEEEQEEEEQEEEEQQEQQEQEQEQEERMKKWEHNITCLKENEKKWRKTDTKKEARKRM